MKIGQYCQRQRCRHVELEQFWQAFASRGFVSDSWAFLYSVLTVMKLEFGYKRLFNYSKWANVIYCYGRRTVSINHT